MTTDRNGSYRSASRLASWLCLGASSLALLALSGCRDGGAREYSPADASDAPASPAHASARSTTPKGTGAAKKRVPSQVRSSVSINLSGPSSWSRQRVFLDAFKYSRSWIPQKVVGGSWDTKKPIATNEQGWVKELAPGDAASTMVADGGLEAYPNGRYVLTYKGKGTLEVGLAGKMLHQEPGRVVLMKSGPSVLIKITRTSASDPIRDIAVVPEAYQKSHKEVVFYPPFIEQLEAMPFGALRFMDLMNTNGSTVTTWSSRTTPDASTQAAKTGVAIEYLIELANRTKRHAWFCVPHLASDDYVRGLARLIKEELDPELKAYVEYSNEVWNPQFPQAEYAATEGARLHLAEDRFQGQLRYYSQRAVEVFRIMEEELGTDAPLVRVLSGQSANPWTGEQVLSWKNASRHADAYAIAPYFGGRYGAPKAAAEIKGWSDKQFIEALHEEIRTELTSTMRKNAELARQHGLRLIAYEGGQHLVGIHGQENNEKLEATFTRLNRDAKMGDLYGEYLRAWQSAGGSEFFLYAWVGAPSKWGSWGMFETLTATETPKSRAVIEFAKSVSAPQP